ALTYRLAARLQQMMQAKGMISTFKGPKKQLETIFSKQMEKPKEDFTVPVIFKDRLVFENISFKYPHKNDEALKYVYLEIPKNQVIALVGASGAGKSSLIDLLLRLYLPSQGRITLDGIPIESFTQEKWRKLFGVVSQDPFLFNATILENLRY